MHKSLIFVYNAEAGWFNTLADIGHKLFSPASYPCALCTLTHGLFKEKRAWKDFIAQLPIPCEFLHRDQFEQRHPEFSTTYPVVLLHDHAHLQIVLSSTQLARCQNLEQLQQHIHRQLSQLGLQSNGFS